MTGSLPPRSTVWENHNDEVSPPPAGFRVLAHSANCAMQAMEDERRGRFAVQFHPEVEHTQFGTQIFQNFIGICKR